MAHQDEIELKFELDAHSAGKVRNHALLKKADHRKWFQRTVYYDTGDRKIHSKGYTLRVRQVGNRFTQTVKTNSRAAGLLDRGEWEAPVLQLEPDLIALEQTPLGKLKGLDGLEPVSQSDVTRTSWTVGHNGSDIEVVLDSGRLSAGDRNARFHELEIELKDGDVGEIFAAAHELSRSAPLEIGVLSKSQRGFMLSQNLLGNCHKASGLDIRKKMDASQAVVAIVHECIRHFRLNEAAIIADRDPEALHQARVAIRRLRTAFSFFRPVIRQDVLDPLRKELRSFTVPFGKARNLDVFIAAHGKELPPKDRRKLKRARDKAYEQAIEAMGGQAIRDIFLELVEWAAVDDWKKGGATDPVGKFAAKRLDAVWSKIKRNGSRLADLDEWQLHRLRIRVKKLRYAVEFMAALYPKKKTRKFTAALEHAQDCLGLLHDDIIARNIIDEFSLDFMAGTEGNARSHCSKKAKVHFLRLKRLGRIWAR